MHDHVVSVTPISLDMTSRTDAYRLQRMLSGEERISDVKPVKVRAL